MAPPPPATLPLTQRLMRLAETLQFGWFVGHLTLLFCTLRYGLSYMTFNYYSRWAQFSYRTAFFAAAATYGIVVYKAFRARARTGAKMQGGIVGYLADENVQYLFMALVWLFSRQIPLALLPFSVYSIFHVLTYTRSNLLPTIQPPATGPASPGGRTTFQSSPIQNMIGKFVKEYYDSSMTVVALLEIGLWFRVFLSVLTFNKGAFLLLAVYTVFFRARFAQSAFVQGAIRQATARVDAIVSQQSTPPAARQGWETFKKVVEQAADATDIRRYTSQGAPKKAQ
ncbi:MAG: hypothetical protein M1834_007456 [Cirrosporium novae-zelandiae]|nr:MAG: hypothetical protein M1834_007456 [Cirrosporium novae-zelandiae]